MGTGYGYLLSALPLLLAAAVPAIVAGVVLFLMYGDWMKAADLSGEASIRTSGRWAVATLAIGIAGSFVPLAKWVSWVGLLLWPWMVARTEARAAFIGYGSPRKLRMTMASLLLLHAGATAVLLAIWMGNMNSLSMLFGGFGDGPQGLLFAVALLGGCLLALSTGIPGVWLFRVRDFPRKRATGARPFMTDGPHDPAAAFPGDLEGKR